MKLWLVYAYAKRKCDVNMCYEMFGMMWPRKYYFYVIYDN